MELNLHPIATKCCVSGREFAEGDRVVCYLVREADGLTGRRDLLENEDPNLQKPAEVFCRWVIRFKPRKGEENADRTLKMTAENLFVALADPLNPPNETNTPLLQFLALMLERKKILKPRGVTADGVRNIFEHARSHQRYEIPVGDLDAKFFVKIQSQLDVLVGPKSQKTTPVQAGPAISSPTPENSSSPEDGSVPE